MGAAIVVEVWVVPIAVAGERPVGVMIQDLGAVRCLEAVIQLHQHVGHHKRQANRRYDRATARDPPSDPPF